MTHCGSLQCTASMHLSVRLTGCHAHLLFLLHASFWDPGDSEAGRQAGRQAGRHTGRAAGRQKSGGLRPLRHAEVQVSSVAGLAEGKCDGGGRRGR